MKSSTWGGEGDSTPLQYSCLENPMGGGAWQAAVHGVAKSRTRLSVFTFIFMHWRRKWQPTPVFLPGESQGQGSLLGCRLRGRTESDMTEATQQQQQQYMGRKLHTSFSCQLEYSLNVDQDKDSFWRPRQFLHNSHPSLICYPYMVQPALYYSSFL